MGNSCMFKSTSNTHKCLLPNLNKAGKFGKQPSQFVLLQTHRTQNFWNQTAVSNLEQSPPLHKDPGEPHISSETGLHRQL